MAVERRTITIKPPVSEAELSNCDREPIHVPGSIQPHGVLLALDPATDAVVHASANVGEHFGKTPEQVLGRGLDAALGGEWSEILLDEVRRQRIASEPTYLRTVLSAHNKERVAAYHAMAHYSKEGLLVVELEAASSADAVLFKDLYPLTTRFVARLQGLRDEAALTELAASEVRRITAFDRVLVYRFDPEWNGTVVAESRNDRLPSYMGHRFPASDIPRQARELYRLNRLRIIPRAEYEPVEIVPQLTPGLAKPLDLTYSLLRSVSPVHLEYMRNMGTSSSMSVSILRNGELWGLISCHHRDPKQVGFDVRVACDYLAQVLSVQMEANEFSRQYAERIRLKNIETRLIAHMTGREKFVDGLLQAGEELLSFGDASGAAVLFEGECYLIGSTPDEEQVRRLTDWVSAQGEREVTATDCLGEVFHGGREFAAVASGLLAIRISKLHRSYVLWFRPEVVETIRWGGDPHKLLSGRNGDRLHPRKSFETWQETVRGRSLPWLHSQLEAATDLRNSVVGIVLRKAEELAELTGELERTNKELEAFSYSVSHDLRAPFRHIVGYAELLREQDASHLSERGGRYVQTIIDSAKYAGSLVDNLLNFSRIGRAELTMVPIRTDNLVEEVIREVDPEAGQRKIDWHCSELPDVVGDPIMLRLVWRNLISNAVKYTREQPEPQVRILAERSNGEVVFSVADNGVGFDMRYVDKLFGVFQRLHRMEDFEGTGIGLANVRRIVSRHKGRTWAEGEVGKGATFYFTLPVNPVGEVH